MKRVRFASRTPSAVGVHRVARPALSIYVGAGRRLGGAVASASELGRRLLLVARSLGDPRCPVLPPGSGPLLGLRQPFVGVARRLRTGEEMGLRIAWRIDEARDMPGIAEHEPAAAGHQLRRLVAASP